MWILKISFKTLFYVLKSDQCIKTMCFIMEVLEHSCHLLLTQQLLRTPADWWGPRRPAVTSEASWPSSLILPTFQLSQDLSCCLSNQGFTTAFVSWKPWKKIGTLPVESQILLSHTVPKVKAIPHLKREHICRMSPFGFWWWQYRKEIDQVRIFTN